jgi:hypothetical protein
MLVIRRAQTEALARAAFKAWMKIHLEQFMPAHCQALGPAGTRAAIEHGIQKAACYGITAEPEVCQYIDLMFCFGRDFDEDPALPWARAILDEPVGVSPMPKIDRLFRASMDYLRDAALG